MGEYSEAREFYERNLETRKIALSPDYSGLVMSYLSFASYYEKLRDYLATPRAA